MMQVTPDGDYTQTGVEWNKVGYANSVHSQYVAGPGAQRAVLLPRVHRVAAGSSRFPWVVAPAQPTAPVAVLASNITWNAYNNFGGRSNYIHADGLPPTPTVNARAELKRYTDAGSLHLGRRRLPAAVVRPARAVQPHRLRRADHRPDRGPAGVPPRPGRVAAARLAGARGLRLRLLRRDAAPRRHARPVRVPRAGARASSRILDAADVRPRQALGVRGGRPADVPRRQRAELRGRAARRRLDDRATTASSTGLAVDGHGRAREPVRDAARVGGEPARRRVHAGRRDDRRAVPRASTPTTGPSPGPA